MDERAIRGVPWALLAYAAQRATFLVTLPVLARLLTPDDFGVVALATLAITVMTVFRDFGLGGALVLHQGRDRRVEGTMLSIVVASSMVLAVLVAGVAPVVASLFESPRLEGVLRLLSISVLLQGIAGFYDMLLQRELAFRARFVALMASSVTYAAVAIALAVLGAGVWSVAIGQLASTAALVLLLVVLAPFRIRLALDRPSARSSLRVGSGFVLQAASAVLRQNADYLVVARLLGTTSLGYYTFAYRLGDLPNQAVAEPVAKVTFPEFARAEPRGEAIGPRFLAVLRLLAVVVTPLGILLSACAEPLTLTLFGDQWRPLVPVLAVMGLWAIIRPLETTLAWLVNSLGDPAALGRLAVVLLIPLIPGLVVAAEVGGLQAVAWTMVVSDAISLLAVSRLVRTRACIGAAALWKALRPVVPAALASWAVARTVAATAGGAPDVAALVLSGAAGLAAYVGTLAAVDRSLLPWVLSHAERMLARRSRDVLPPLVEQEVPAAPLSVTAVDTRPGQGSA